MDISDILSLEKKVSNLEEHLAVLEATVKRLNDQRPKELEEDELKHYTLKENDDWIYGITERRDGQWSSVWMSRKR